jgi:hypothetical protein
MEEDSTSWKRILPLSAFEAFRLPWSMVLPLLVFETFELPLGGTCILGQLYPP